MGKNEKDDKTVFILPPINTVCAYILGSYKQKSLIRA